MENTSNYSCPKSKVAFGFTDIFPSITIPQLINTLRFECENGCGEYFDLGEAKKYQNHKQSCRGPKPPPLSFIHVLSVQANENMPREAEKVALHVIQHKLANSTHPNQVLFPRGVPRVITFFAHKLLRFLISSQRKLNIIIIIILKNVLINSSIREKNL